MPTTLKQTTAFGPGIYRGQPFTRERLRSFVEGTNKAIAAGIAIPLLKKHARINASDRETEQFAKDDGQGLGWVTKVDLGTDGGLVWEAKDVPDSAAQEIREGTLKLTSPEFRNHYTCEKAGVYEGPIIRHIAFTPLPGNPHQGPIVETASGSQINAIALEETLDAWQFAEEEKQPLPAELQYSEGITDEATWEKAKKAVDKDKYKGDSYWAVVSTVYKNMGGKYSHKSESQHSETAVVPPKEPTGTTADQYSEDSWVLPYADFLPWLQSEATEQFAHREPANEHMATELELVNHHNVRHLDEHQYMKSGPEARGEHHLHQQRTAILSNLSKKHAKGVYDHEKAKKLWGYYAKSLSDHYKQHYGTGANPATRSLLASKLADYHKEHNFEQYEEMVPVEETEQFSDQGDNYHNTLLSHGFKRTSKGIAGGGHSYGKFLGKATVPHTVVHIGRVHGKTSGNWSFNQRGKLFTYGDSHESLKKHLDSHQYAEDVDPTVESSVPPDTTQINPDMPPKTPDRNKLVAILAGLAEKNIVLPSTFTFDDPAAMDILLGCINSAIKAENETRAEVEPADPDDEPVTEASMPYSEQFNEYASALTKHGWKMQTDAGGINTYAHPNLPGRAIHVKKDGSWTAHKVGAGFKGAVATGGKATQLSSYLTKLHSSLKNMAQFEESEVQQFASGYSNPGLENTALHKHLVAHGYKPSHHNEIANGTSYWRDGGYGVKTLNDSKGFSWIHSGGKKGRGLNSLLAHLESIHGSQHSETQTQVGDYIMQFTEEEIAAMPHSLKAKLDAEVAAQKKAREDAEAKAAQFEEEKKQQLNASAMEKMISGLKAAPIPPGMKRELLSSVENVQFAEGVEVPTYTTEQMVVLFAKYIPKHLQFTEDELTTSDPPKGRREVGKDEKGQPVYAEDTTDQQYFEQGETPPGHVSAARANELVNSSPVVASHRTRHKAPTVAESVAKLNADADKSEYKGWGNQ